MEEVVKTSFWDEIALNFFNGMSPAYMISLFFFIAVGAIVSIIINVRGRDKGSENTPHSFSLKFFIADNWGRLLGNVLIAFFVVRFFSEVFPDKEISMFWAALIGMAFDYVIVGLRELMYWAQKQFGIIKPKYNGDERV